MPKLVPVEHDPFSDGSVECIFPTTSVQREILLGAWLGGEDANRAFNECLVLQLTGPLDTAAFEAAYRKLVHLHDTLRTTFTTDGEWGVVSVSGRADLSRVDLSALPQDVRQSALEALRNHEVTTAFALDSGPLHRATLVCLSERTHQLLFSAHHVICDWWSCGVLLVNLGLLYRQQRGGKVGPLEVASFGAYAVEQQRLENGPEGQTDLGFWNTALAGYVQNWTLPSNCSARRNRTYSSRRLDVEWTEEVSSAVRQLAKRHNCTLTVVLLSILQLWLYLEVGARDVIVGVPAAGQALVSAGGLAGHCVYLLPVRLMCTSDMTLQSVFPKCKATMLHALDHRSTTYSRLLEQSSFRRPGHPPLVQLTANVDMGLPRLDFDDMTVEYATIPRRYDAFELSINLVASSPRLTVQAQFNTDRSSETAVTQWVADWANLARIALEFPTLELQGLAAEG